MPIQLAVLNTSTVKRAYRRDVLARLADRVLRGEGVDEEAELSLLFCDDATIQELNRQYRNKDVATDVLSFGQPPVPANPVRVLGDIVISLETVTRQAGDDPAARRAEVALLFCHGLLHLLGFDHDTRERQAAMIMKQSEYLGCEPTAAWRYAPGETAPDSKYRSR
jgi:probable rRNA maturation factor